VGTKNLLEFLNDERPRQEGLTFFLIRVLLNYKSPFKSADATSCLFCFFRLPPINRGKYPAISFFDKRKLKMKRLLHQRGVFAGLVLCALFILTPSTRSHAIGIDLGEHCWSGDNTGVIIRHRITQFRNFYNLNGKIIATGIAPSPAYGTAFFDSASNKVVMGYTIERATLNDAATVHMELTPGTLNGTKVLTHQG